MISDSDAYDGEPVASDQAGDVESILSRGSVPFFQTSQQAPMNVESLDGQGRGIIHEKSQLGITQGISGACGEFPGFTAEKSELKA
jgi:hypothetical protein